MKITSGRILNCGSIALAGAIFAYVPSAADAECIGYGTVFIDHDSPHHDYPIFGQNIFHVPADKAVIAIEGMTVGSEQNSVRVYTNRSGDWKYIGGRNYFSSTNPPSPITVNLSDVAASKKGFDIALWVSFREESQTNPPGWNGYNCINGESSNGNVHFLNYKVHGKKDFVGIIEFN